MADLKLTVLSLRYSSWSMRPWLLLTHAGARFETETVELESFETTTLAERRKLGSVSGLFPILRVDGTPIHESLAIAEYAAESFPEARLWPQSSLDRARARAISCEMVGNFSAIRSEMSCHLFGRTLQFSPSGQAVRNIDRVFEIWADCLSRSGGPYLFGQPTIADFFYFPVLTRFRTYGIAVPAELSDYTTAIDRLPAVESLIEKARSEPSLAVYDNYLRKLGGDPIAAI
jgi:glutathione S-transferase